MGKNQSASNLTNIVKYDNNGNVSFVSGSTTLLSVSSSGALTTTSTITAQTLVVQTITSSTDFITGSAKFGTLATNTFQFTGSMLVSGSIGVNTTSPVSSLHINEISSSITLSKTVSALSSSVGSLEWRNNYSGNYVWAKIDAVTLGTSANPWDYSNITFSTWNGFNSLAERMRITNAGNVGINCVPNVQFEVFGASGNILTDGIRISRNTLQSSQYGQINYAAGILNLTGVVVGSGGDVRINSHDGTTNKEIARFTSSGNIGIGTTSPAVHGNAGYITLTIVGGATSRGWLELGTSTATSTGNIFGQISGFNGTNARAGEIRFYENGTANQCGVQIATLNSGTIIPCVWISPAGFLKTSNTGTLFTSANTTVYEFKSDQNDDTFRVFNSNTSYNAAIIQARGSRNTTASNWYFLQCYNDGSGLNKLLIADSGNVTNTNGSYGAFSDIKLKENIVDTTPKLADLLNVKIRNYNLIGDTQKQIGVIAQELEQIFPGMVEETEDKDAEGKPLGTTTKSVKYSVFVPMLVKAVQELKAEIDELKNNK